jgi:hypothetical protein
MFRKKNSIDEYDQFDCQRERELLKGLTLKYTKTHFTAGATSIYDDTKCNKQICPCSTEGFT